MPFLSSLLPQMAAFLLFFVVLLTAYPFASLDDVRAVDLEDPRHYYNLDYNRIPEKTQREERLNSFLRQSQLRYHKLDMSGLRRQMINDVGAIYDRKNKQANAKQTTTFEMKNDLSSPTK
ncbi:hypothetical protein WR25_18376 [Diploscapter pachys]|uniref:Uncharacterized protein n=1 Tax=Diploscapter pachys TaxID=2018661 RepID=A0A2A2JZQ9_9BILA|nr:hypothetical protein WR25_18376 [Diploscapter pachys]